MGFKKLRGVDLPEEQQGLIRYTCLTWEAQPQHVQKKIRRLCDKCGGAESAALWEVMCTRRSITAIAQAHFLSESALYRMCKRFFESW